MKTATIERYHVFGTSRHNQSLTYNGSTLHYWSDGQSVYVQAPCYGIETIKELSKRAYQRGFTHIRFCGDWSGYNVPKTIKIPSIGYVEFKPRQLGDILQSIGAQA